MIVCGRGGGGGGGGEVKERNEMYIYFFLIYKWFGSDPIPLSIFPSSSFALSITIYVVFRYKCCQITKLNMATSTTFLFLQLRMRKTIIFSPVSSNTVTGQNKLNTQIFTLIMLFRIVISIL